jgi:hypothetical protein
MRMRRIWPDAAVLPIPVWAEEGARIRDIHLYNASSCSKLVPMGGKFKKHAPRARVNVTKLMVLADGVVEP